MPIYLYGYQCGDSNNHQQYILAWHRENHQGLEQGEVNQGDQLREKVLLENLFREVRLRKEPQKRFLQRDQEPLVLKEDILMGRSPKVSRKQQHRRKTHLPQKRRLQ